MGCENMKNHSEKAAELFVSGCNCSQAVFGAFAEDCGIDFEKNVQFYSIALHEIPRNFYVNVYNDSAK
mgnify:CR=1 FL=1